MNILLWVIFVTSLAGIFGTGFGGFIGALFKKDSKKMISVLLSFAGGIMISVVCFDLILGALEPEGTNTKVSVYIVILGILIGYGVIYILNYLIDNTTNKELNKFITSKTKNTYSTNQKNIKSSGNLLISGIVMACAIALHNLPEGMVIGASFASGVNNGDVFSGTGIIMAIVIGLHDIPEGMAVSVPLISGGMKRYKAVVLTAFTGIPTVIGAVIGYMLGTMGPILLSLSMSLASGAMLYVIFGELLPESNLLWKSKVPAFVCVIGVLLGLFITQ